MSTPRNLVCLCLLACAAILNAQTPPTAYVITQSVGPTGSSTSTIYRSGSKVLVDYRQSAQDGAPASRSFSFYDLTSGTNTTWNPDATPITCNVGTFSGDWGDPFATIAELQGDIAKGDLKLAGNETIAGIATQVYTGTTQGTGVKAWIDTKDGLVIRVQVSSPGAAVMTMVDITKVSLVAPPASRFVLPGACAGLKPPPTAAQLIADETGDDPANYVSNAGPGTKNSCSVVLRVVSAKTMTPITHIQVVIDTAVFPDNAPPAYTMGVSDDGTTSYSGGHVMEITNRVHNGVVRLGLPPDHFMLGVNIPLPHHGGGIGLVYRQCFAPTTVLLDVVKDYGKDDQSQDLLWVKAGKYAVPPAQ